MLEQVEVAVRELWNPRYLHLVLQPFLIHGLILAGLFALLAFLLKQPRAVAVGLLLAVACALAVLPWQETRTVSLPAMQREHSRYDATEMAGIGEVVARYVWIYFTVAGLAGVAFFAVLARAKSAAFFLPLAALTAIAAGVWGLAHHHRDALLFHPEVVGAVKPPPARNQDSPRPASLLPPSPERPGPPQAKPVDPP